MSGECPLCGEAHEPGPEGIASGPFAGIRFQTCPEIPENCVYEDREYEKGPRGALHLLDLREENQ